MWEQTYLPIAGHLFWSALVAALPIFALIFTLAIKRMAAWKSALVGVVATELVALVAYHMPVGTSLSALAYGAAFGLFPIGWIVYWAILLYRITVDTGKFEIIKDSVANLTGDHCLQA